MLDIFFLCAVAIHARLLKEFPINDAGRNLAVGQTPVVEIYALGSECQGANFTGNQADNTCFSDTGVIYGTNESFIQLSSSCANNGTYIFFENGCNSAIVTSTSYACFRSTSGYDAKVCCSSNGKCPLAPPPTKPSICKPQNGLDLRRCKERIEVCKNTAPMKFGGKGCVVTKRVKGKKVKTRLLDGGCQCKGYCGYNCPGSCVADKECSWNGNFCVVKATGLPGVPITEC